MTDNAREFPSEDRINAIGQNGNTGEHYKAKYIIKCYNRHDDLMLRPDNMEDAHKWIDQNDGYFLVEVVR